MLKKFKVLTIVFALLLTSLMPLTVFAASGDPTISITLDKSNYVAGDKVIVSIDVKDNMPAVGLNAYEMKITYDHPNLGDIKPILGNWTNMADFGTPQPLNSGVYTITGYSSSAIMDNKLAVLEFTIPVGTTDGTYDISITGIKIRAFGETASIPLEPLSIDIIVVPEPDECDCDICIDCGKCLDALAGNCDCADCPGACDCKEEPDPDFIITAPESKPQNPYYDYVRVVPLPNPPNPDGAVNRYVIEKSTVIFTAKLVDAKAGETVDWKIIGNTVNETKITGYVNPTTSRDGAAVYFCDCDRGKLLTIEAIRRDKAGIITGVAYYKVIVTDKVPNLNPIIIQNAILCDDNGTITKEFVDAQANDAGIHLELMAHVSQDFKAKADLTPASGDMIKWTVENNAGGTLQNNTGFAGNAPNKERTGTDVTFSFCHNEPIGTVVKITAVFYKWDESAKTLIEYARDKILVKKVAGVNDNKLTLKSAANSVDKRGTVQFTAIQAKDENNIPYTDPVKWYISTTSNITSDYTLITKNGLLIVGQDETATTITVVAQLPNLGTASLPIVVRDLVCGGTSTWVPCPVCRETIDPNDDECGACGTPVTPPTYPGVCPDPLHFVERVWADEPNCPTCKVPEPKPCPECGVTPPDPSQCPDGICEPAPCPDEIEDLSCPTLSDFYKDKCDIAADFLVMLSPCATGAVDMFWKTQEPVKDKVSGEYLSRGIIRDKKEHASPKDSIFYICASVDGGETWSMFKHWDYADASGNAKKNIGTQNPWAANYDKYYPGFNESNLVLGQDEVSIEKLLKKIPKGTNGEIIFRLYVGNIVSKRGNDDVWAITSQHDSAPISVAGTGSGITVNKAALQAKVDAIKNEFETTDVYAKYNNWDEALSAPFAAAEAVLANANATQEQVNTALANLNAAYLTLTLKGGVVVAGDINGDGNFNINDVYALFDYYVMGTLNQRQMDAFKAATGYNCIANNVKYADIEALFNAWVIA